MPNWDKLFQKQGFLFQEIEACVGDFQQRYLNRSMSILDNGCGGGRHSVYLSKFVKEIYAVDISDTAISALSERIKKENINNIQVFKSNIDSLPFKNDFFDAIISINVIAHGRIDEIKSYLKESFRVLKKEGFYLLRTPHKDFINTIRKKDTKEIEEGTYITTDAPDGDIIHHFFSEEELKEIFSNFEIIDLKSEEETSKWTKRKVPEITLIARKL